MTPPKVHSIPAVAKILDCSPWYLYQRPRIDDRMEVSPGQWLRFIKIGRFIKVPDAELRRFLGEEA